MPPTFITTTFTLVLSLVAFLLPVHAQSNVTIRDVDPRITFTPLCSPRGQQCAGGWYNFNTTATDTRTVTFGPSLATRNVQPSASFAFNGTAIYYYAVTSGRAASVIISLDGGPNELVNLTSANNLTYASGIYYPTFAWSAKDLNPDRQHTFYLEFAEPDALALGKWSGFDSLVYTPSNPATRTVTGTAVTTIQGGLATGGNSSHKSGLGSGTIIGIAFAGTFGALLIVGLIVWYCVKKRERPLSAWPPPDDWSIDTPNARDPRRSGVTRIHSVYQGVGAGPMPPIPAEEVPLPTSPTSPSPPASSRRTSRQGSRRSAGGSTTMMMDLRHPDSIAYLMRQQQEILELLRSQGVMMGEDGNVVAMSPQAASSMSPFATSNSRHNSLMVPQAYSMFSPSTTAGQLPSLPSFPSSNQDSYFTPSPSTPQTHLSWLPDTKSPAGPPSNPFVGGSVPTTPSPPLPPPSSSDDSSAPTTPSDMVRSLPEIPGARRQLPMSPLANPPLPPMPSEPPSSFGFSVGGLQRSNTTSASINTYRTGPPAYSPD